MTSGAGYRTVFVDIDWFRWVNSLDMTKGRVRNLKKCVPALLRYGPCVTSSRVQPNQGYLMAFSHCSLVAFSASSLAFFFGSDSAAILASSSVS